MKDILYYLLIIFEFLPLLIAIIYYPFLRNSYLKWILPFLLCVCVVEVLNFYERNRAHWSNLQLNALVGIAESLFYNYVFYRLCHRKNIRRFIFVSAVLSIAAYILYILFWSYSAAGVSYCLVLSGFFLSANSLTYMYLQVVDEDKSHLMSQPGFWIALGVLLFFSGISIVFSLHDYILKNNLALFGLRLYHLVPQVLCIFLYSALSIAIIMHKRSVTRNGIKNIE